jgi:hypothetical protein
VQKLKIDNETLKTELRDLKRACHEYDVRLLLLPQKITLRRNRTGILCVQWVAALVPQLRLEIIYPNRQIFTAEFSSDGDFVTVNG